ncbi:MAG: acyltransferase [Verrucomicrobiota bacterium]
MKLNLRRITTSNFYLPELDGLRFLAIMPVVYTHSRTYILGSTPAALSDQLTIDVTKWIGYFSGFGVPLFYCISGFILSLPFARYCMGTGKEVKIGKFYMRRLTRLEPPYILSLTFFYLVHVFINGESFTDLLPNFLASFFYLHNVVFGEWSYINPVAWTLEIEFQFYLIAPFISLLIFRLRSALRVAVLLFLMVFFVTVEIYASAALSEVNLNRTIITKAHYFLGGFLCCHLYLNDSSRFTRKSYFWDCAAIAAFFLTGFRFMVKLDPSIDLYIAKLVFTFAILLFFLAGFKGKLTNKLMSLAPISIIGGMCYSIYLLHYPIIHFIGKVIKPNVIFDGYLWLDILIYMAVYTPIVISVCAVFYVLIERPCMDPAWPKKLIGYFRKK